MNHRQVSRRLFRAVTLITVALIALYALARPETAAAAPTAHPLGNFSINRYSRIELGRSAIQVYYVLDMAEIPTFQEMEQIDRDRDSQVSDAERDIYLHEKVEELGGRLHLALNGAPAMLSLAANDLSFLAGQGGLNTLRLTAVWQAPVGTDSEQRLDYRDDNYAERLGWKEIVVRAGDGVKLLASSAPAQDQSDELRTYPEDMLSSPLEVTEAHATFSPDAGAASADRAASAVAAEQKKAQDGFAALIAEEELSVSFIMFSLIAAAFWGALHAFTPGHGKTVVAAYLVGARGTAKHALFLGLTTTITHTAGVFALGLITLFASHYIVPEQLYPWLGFASGVLVAVIGVNLFVSRLRAARRRSTEDHHHHNHDHHHDHHHHDPAHSHSHHDHSHLPPGTNGAPVTWRSLLALGVSGGLLPCPSALVVMLSAIALNRVAYGMILVLAFSAGLAGVLTATGLALLYARRFFDRFDVAQSRAFKLIPVGSALVIAVAGLGVAIQALIQAGLL
jgi:ABC-type nickel/cobalt efflux system permease component RcnA